MTEDALHNIETARMIEHNNFPECNCSIVESLIEEHPLIKQNDYKLLPRIVQFYIDDWQQIISYLDVILQLAKDNSQYEDIVWGNLYDVIDCFDEGIKEFVRDRKLLLDKIRYDHINEYTIKPIETFEEAAKYKEYADWCISEGQGDYEYYTDGGELFYFCMKTGYEKEPKESKEGFPWDDYGKSLFAVSVNRHGLIANVTCRWNVESNGIHKMDDEALSRLIGNNFYDVFIPREIS